MMLFTLTAVLGLATPALSYSNTYTVQYDPKYDDKETSLKHVTCSVGEHGLITHGYKKLGDIPTFPNLGAAPHIESHESSYCGSCWELTFFDEHIGDISVNFTAIDRPGAGSEDDFVISLEGMENLTHGQAKELNIIQVTASRKPSKWCFPHKQ